MKFRSFLILFAATSLTAFAQYDQDIAVEGKYTPEYINHDRIGTFPKPIRFPLEKSTLQYSLSGINADFTPQAVPIQATGWKSTRDFTSHRGYVELGIGSWLESTLSAGYRFIDTRESALGLRLQHNSTSLWNPKLSENIDNKMERYDESIGIYGHHTFGTSGRLDAAFDYHLGNFDYYGMLFDKAPTQTLNDVAARVAWHSPSSLDNVSWNAGAGIRYFGYRRYYLPGEFLSIPSLTGGRETDLNINGGVVFPTSSKSALGIDLNADFLSYGKPSWRTDELLSEPLSALDSYGMASLTPYYRFTRSKLNILLGARIDLTFNAGPENDRYGVFHIAPDIRLDYDAGPIKFYLYALGGSYLHTLASGYELDYYQAPSLTATTPVYTPVDAKLGVTFGPFSGFHAGFDIAFRTSRGQYFGGMYQPYLNSLEASQEFAPVLDLPWEIDGRPVEYSFAPGSKSNLTGFSFGLNTGYDTGRYFKINAEARFQHQNGKTGYFNGYDRPEWTLDLSAETNPWKTLKFKLGYNLRAMRMMPVRAHYADTTPLNSNLTVMYRLPNLSMLNFGASYGINDSLNVWMQADNLLNRKYYYMAGLPEPGIRLSIGAGFYF